MTLLSSQVIEPARNVTRLATVSGGVLTETASILVRHAATSISYTSGGTPYVDTLPALAVAQVWGGSGATQFDITQQTYVSFIIAQLGSVATLYVTPSANLGTVGATNRVVPLDNVWRQTETYWQPRTPAAPPPASVVWIVNNRNLVGEPYTVGVFAPDATWLYNLIDTDSLLNGPWSGAQVGDAVWIACAGNNTVARVTQTLTSAGTALSGGNLSAPNYVCVVGDAVWVSNLLGSYISRYNPDGTPYGAGDLAFAAGAAQGITVVGADEVWVAATPSGPGSLLVRLHFDGSSAGADIVQNSGTPLGINQPAGMATVIDGATTTVWAANYQPYAYSGDTADYGPGVYATDGTFLANYNFSPANTAYYEMSDIKHVGSTVWSLALGSYHNPGYVSQLGLDGTFIQLFANPQGLTQTGIIIVTP